MAQIRTYSDTSSPFLFVLHGVEANQNGPDVSAGLGDHQHSHRRDRIRKQHHRDIAGKAQHHREPQEPEGLILRFLCAAVKQNDDQRAEDGKRDVAVP